MRRSIHLLVAAAVFIALCLMAVACDRDRPQVDVQGISNLDSLTLRDYLVVGKMATFQGALSAGSTLSVSTFQSFGIPAASGVITVTMNGYITPTNTLQPLAAAGAVGTANLAAGATGRVLVLWNKTTNTITISDTGTILLSADWAGTQYDTLTLFSDGTNWIELARATN
jgi:hypothetical protein